MENITYQSFQKEAEEMAKNAIYEAISNGATDREKAEEMAREYLRESVDSHAWVIYTGRAWEIVSLIRKCDSEIWHEAHDRLMDTEDGKIQEGEDLDNAITRLAYWILLCEAESWLSSMTLYSAGWNIPGYLPDSDPAIFTDFETARNYISEEMARAADDQGMIRNDQIAKREYFAAAEQCESEINDAKAWVEEQTGRFSVTAGGYAYWVGEV